MTDMSKILTAYIESKEKEYAEPAIESKPLPRRPWSKFARMLLGR